MAEQQMFKERSATSVLATAPPTFETSQSLFHVYRLEEDVSLLKEGGGRLSVWTLRACSYKTKTEAWGGGGGGGGVGGVLLGVGGGLFITLSLRLFVSLTL